VKHVAPSPTDNRRDSLQSGGGAVAVGDVGGGHQATALAWHQPQVLVDRIQGITEGPDIAP
jgi:hypothetical protein